MFYQWDGLVLGMGATLSECTVSIIRTEYVGMGICSRRELESGIRQVPLLETGCRDSYHGAALSAEVQ